jgi:hypothetical protein
MALRFVLNNEIGALPARELLGAGLLRVEMVKTGLARDYLTVLGNFESLRV